jgi:hypothetical protein
VFQPERLRAEAQTTDVKSARSRQDAFEHSRIPHAHTSRAHRARILARLAARAARAFRFARRIRRVKIQEGTPSR